MISDSYDIQLLYTEDSINKYSIRNIHTKKQNFIEVDVISNKILKCNCKQENCIHVKLLNKKLA